MSTGDHKALYFPLHSVLAAALASSDSKIVHGVKHRATTNSADKTPSGHSRTKRVTIEQGNDGEGANEIC